MTPQELEAKAREIAKRFFEGEPYWQSELIIEILTALQSAYSRGVKDGKKEAAEEINLLLNVLNAHEVQTEDCDRAGRVFCDCLERAKDRAAQFVKENQ